MGFVETRLAMHVITALRDVYLGLRAGDVVVSNAYETLVLDAVRRRSGVRNAYVMREVPVDLTNADELWPTLEDLHLQLPSSPSSPGGPGLVVRRTFLEYSQDSDARSVVTCSTTDINARIPNPRRNPL